jgi:L-fuconolactonase
MSLKPSRIDGHVHLWRLAQGEYGWISDEMTALRRDFEPADVRPLLDGAGIEGAVLVQAAPTVAETRFLLEHARAAPWLVGVVGWLDMEAPDAPAVLAELAEDRHLRGIRPMIQDIADPDWVLRGALGPAFRALIAHDLTFDALVLPHHLGNLLRLLERHPELRTVIDHGAKPRIADGAREPWASEMRRLARETGALCKLSGLATEAGPNWSDDTLRPFVDVLIEAFGPERLIFGSDWPVLTLAGDYAGWHACARRLTAGLGEDAQGLVFGGNATRAYRL